MWLKLFTRQFAALTWKNYIHRKRHFTTVFMEIAIPVAMIFALYGLKSLFKVREIEEYIPKYYDAGTVQSFDCMYEDTQICNENLVYYCSPDLDCTYPQDGWYCGVQNTTQWDFDQVHEELECQPRRIGVAPADHADESAVAAAIDFIAWANNVSSYAQSMNTFKYFDSETAFLSEIERKQYSREENGDVFSSAVVFDGGYPAWDFTLRLNQTYYKGGLDYDAPYTTGSVSDFSMKSRRDRSEDLYETYLKAAFNTHVFTLQSFVQSFIATTTCRNMPDRCSNDESVHVNIAGVAEFPNETLDGPGFWAILSFLFALLIVIASIYPFSNVIRMLVEEKESRVREGMLIMSLRQDALWASWVFHFYTTFLVIACLFTAVSSLLFDYSDMGFIFLYYFLYFTAGVSFCIFISTLFSKARTAINIGSFLIFCGYFVYLGMDLTVTPFSRSEYLAACLHPSAALGFGSKSFQEYEQNRIGINSSSWDISNDYPFTFADIIMMLVIDTIVWGGLAWYCNKVVPTDYGTPAPWYFIFMPDYWLQCCQSVLWCFTSVGGGGGKDSKFNIIPTDDTGARPRTPQKYVEDVTEDLQAQISSGSCVDIKGLRKEFETKTGLKVAVDNLNLTMFGGQITALLGHNGAGKTTLISMLTGMLPSDAGTAVINGYDISTNLDHIRETLGVCPQHDILFADMTVEEHLILYAKFKGVTGAQMAEEINGMLRSIGLTEKRHVMSAALSGGQKRKLSVGIAFIGGSKVVILDEPTSGMDPYSRRFTWNVIRQHREGRIIVLTTHFMDEADLLGDRIAIMGGGKLLCCGSSLYLKNSFGVGYNMVVEKDTLKFDADMFMNHVHDIVSEANVLTDVAGEIVVQLPFASSVRFEDLFLKMDANSTEWGIVSYGMSVTTLEEVFINVATKGSYDKKLREEEEKKRSVADAAAISSEVAIAEGQHSDKYEEDIEMVKMEAAAANTVRKPQQDSVPPTTNYVEVANKSEDELHASEDRNKNNKHSTALEHEAAVPVHISEFHTFCRHLVAMFTKRQLYFRRDWKTMILQFALPFLFLLSGMLVIEFVDWYVPQPSMELKPQMYNENINSDLLPTVYTPDYYDECNWCTDDYKVDDTYSGDDFYSGGGQALCKYQCELYSSRNYTGFNAVMKSISDADNFPLAPQDPNAYGADLYSDGFTNSIQAVSRRVLDSSDDFKAAQVGAVSFGYPSEYYGMDASTFRYDNSNGTLSYVSYGIHANYTAKHGGVLYAHLVGQGIARYFDASVSVKSHIHPLPYTTVEREIESNYVTNIIPFYVLLGLPFCGAAWASYVVREREARCKQQQMVSGVSAGAYWIASWAWDSLSWAITASMLIFLICVFPGNPLLTKPEPLKAMVAVFYLSGPSMVGFTYLTSFLFKTPAGAQVVTMAMIFVEGLLLSEFALALRLYFQPSIRDMYKNTLRYIFLLFPPFALGEGLRNLAFIDYLSLLELGGNRKYSPMDWDICGANIVFCAIFTVVYLILTILYEYTSAFSFCTLSRGEGHVIAEAERKASEEHREVRDQDVLDEEERVRRIVAATAAAKDGTTSRTDSPTTAAPATTDVVVVDGFKKVFPNGKYAVRGVSLGMPNGECFGLLGINGAGKSTLLGMLNGDLSPSAGEAHLNGLSMSKHVHECRRNIGFCPQFDALLELLTGREHLELYARIKGIPADKVPSTVEAKLKEFDLTEFADRLAGTYSGGNKRKLSVALAMMGEPSIIFLDEPSTGMDPVARRFMWKVITDTVTKREKCALILTTHSMEECEALCSRIGIMVGGAFRCLGSVQRLRSKYGQGYQLEIGFAVPRHNKLWEKIQRISELLQLNLPPVSATPSGQAPAASVEDGDHQASAVEEGSIASGSQVSVAGPGGARAEEMLLTLEQVEKVLTAAGREAWLPSAEANKEGELAISLHVLGGINASHFASWWLFEECFEKLSALLVKHLGEGRHAVRERQASRVRLEIPLVIDGQPVTLAKLFGLLEPNKTHVGIQDYCISQTSLEQIFNHFAAQQEEEHLNGTVM